MTLLATLAAALLLPGFTPAVSQPAAGTVLSGVFPGTLRQGVVYLPPGYTPAQRYPVVYLLHGMPGSPSEYLTGVDLADWTDAAIASGSVRPFIAVLPAAGPDDRYNGEWGGPWEAAIVRSIVPWIDSHLSTIASPDGRVLAGLSAGGFGAVDIALRNPGIFGRVEAWSGYFQPLHDGPFKHASKAQLAANDPTLLARTEAAVLRLDGVRFFLSSGPYHSHWFRPAETIAFTRELRGLGLPVSYHYYSNRKGEWRAQVDTGLTWAFRPGA
jgi:S-formylglutathione hydrolase FrmB